MSKPIVTLATLRPVYQDPKLTLPGYTEEVHRKILEYVSHAERPQKAALLAGLTSSQWQIWAKQAELGNPLALQIRDDIERARALAEHNLVQTVRTDLKDPAANAKWLLAKMDPKEYSERVTAVVDHEQEQFMALLKARLSPEVYRLVCAAVTDQLSFEE